MKRRASALKFCAVQVWLLLSVVQFAATTESCSPKCSWASCSDGRLQFSGSWFKARNVNHPCLTCDYGSEEPAPLPDASCFRHPKWVGVRGVPFGVLSAAKLPTPEPTQLAFLALVDTKITDLEQNTLANLPYLQELHLEFNNLTEVKTSYFTDIETDKNNAKAGYTALIFDEKSTETGNDSKILEDSTYQPPPGKFDAPHYWEIPDALVDFVPTSDTPREIPDALVNPTRQQPTTGERDEAANYWEIPDADTIPCPHSPLQTISDNTTNSTTRPPSLQHQYCNIPDEDSDSTTFYASAVGAKYSTVTKSEDNSRLYEGVGSRSTAMPQTGDGHSVQATYGNHDFQTASVLVPHPEN
ncbi:Histone-lysine N-methyltransferase smyd1 [Branchiostoma belcheri]|nr:Histone-lysine N-methyltransferase smyd1 [Branchiostoma belcheri]